LLTCCSLFLQRERPHPSTAERDTSVDRPDLEHEPDRKRIEKEKGRKIERDRRDHEKDGEYDSKDLDGPKRKVFPKKLEADTHQGAASISASSYNDNDARKSVYTQEFNFCEKVKEKLEPGAYQEFLKCLHIYSQEIITRSELKNLVNDILQRTPDLMDGFSEFLDHCENIDGFLDGVINKSKRSLTLKFTLSLVLLFVDVLYTSFL
jgi:paired amphipathic helix protein Sin3a